MGTRRSICLSLVALWALGGSGCAVQSLKEQNRRLKEANDRLIAENNRLEEELASLQRGGAREVAAPEGESQVAKAPDVGPWKEGSSSKERSDLAKDLLLDDQVQVDRTSQGVRLRIPDRVFFSPGQVKLTTQGQQILGKVARLINSKDNKSKMVRVDGHTDDTPIRKVKNLFPTNWELSTARACSVVRYLVDSGNVNANRIFPAGFSYYRPVASARSAKSQNRRVEITILNESV